MKTALSNSRTRWRVLAGTMVLAALIGMGSPEKASANSTADATILNVVTVDYKDAGGTNSFAATASTTVTINLVKAALSPSGAPTGADGSPALVCLAASDYASGSTISALYALTATANGADTYSLSIADDTPSTTANVNIITRAFAVLDYQGLTPTSPATRTLGSAIPTAVVSDDTLQFPGGALAGFAANDIVLVEINGTKKAFLVDTVTVGTAPSHDNPGNVAHTDAGSTTAEVKGSLKLKAYPNQTILGQTVGGGNAAPAFASTGAPTLGVPVGEMILVQLDATASVNSSSNGVVGYTLTTTDSASGNSAVVTCTAGNWIAPSLSITKKARNASTGGSFAATATGNPGQILEYEVTISNTGGEASSVVVTDAVPAYTTLVTHSGAYGSGGGTGALADKVAKISDGTNTVDLTVSAVDAETQPLTEEETGFGKAAGTIAGSVLTFYVGNTSTNAAGGKIPSCSDEAHATSAACTGASEVWITTYTILYQVKID
jgi:uncharacterized repeat protein (TIGR01451 family)